MNLVRALVDAWGGLLAAFHPPLAFASAGAAGRLAQRLGRSGPAAAEVAQLFSQAPAAAAVTAREIASVAARNRALRRFAGRRGPGAVEPLVRFAGWEVLAERLAARAPAILLSVPRGPRIATAAGAYRLGATTLVVAGVPRLPYAAWGHEVCAPETGGRGGAIALKTAVDRLRAGGWVLAALEGEVGPGGRPLPMLGGSIAPRPGIAAMARLGGAPIFPVAATWGTGRRPIELTVHPPLAAVAAAGAGRGDRRLLEALARRVEELVRAAPGQCDLRFLRSCLAPGSQSGAASRPER